MNYHLTKKYTHSLQVVLKQADIASKIRVKYIKTQNSLHIPDTVVPLFNDTVPTTTERGVR